MGFPYLIHGLRICPWRRSITTPPPADMVFYFTTSEGFTLYMGRDKFENEELIKWGFDEDSACTLRCRVARFAPTLTLSSPARWPT